MKVNNINNSNNISNRNQAFNGLGSRAVSGMVKATDAIESAGLVATFIAQDGIGSIIPRILTGFTRNSDKTGQLNYKFAALEACREILTGPPVMLLPILTLGYAHKHIGSTLKSPVSSIEFFTNNLKETVNNAGENISDLAKIKHDFYKTSIEKALNQTCKDGYKPNNKFVESLVSLATELENAPKKVKGDKNARTAKVITGEISQLISSELKSNADATGSFAKLAYTDGLGKTAKTSIGTFVEHMQDYSKDFIKKAENLNIQSIEKTANKRIGSRVATNFLTLGAVLLYSIVVPKLYKKLSKTNPGLIGLVDEPEKNNQQITKNEVNYEAFDKLKQNNKQPAFKGLGIGTVAKAVTKDNPLRKFVSAFEFNGINMSFTTLMTFMGLGILTPRVANAYDKHDKREILTRDIFTIAALVFGSKAILKNIANSFEKKTGIVITEKPENYFEKSKTKQLLDRLHPFSGTQVFSNNDIALKYTNVEKFNGGLSGFCDFISKTGGKLTKFFANDKTTKENMEQMLGKALDKATNEEIKNAIADKKNAQFVENIINVFKDANNTFVKKAKSTIGVFGFVSTFFAVPAFMIFLQKFNEKVTKKAIAKEKAEKAAIDQKFTAIKLTTDLIQPEASKLNMK